MPSVRHFYLAYLVVSMLLLLIGAAGWITLEPHFSKDQKGASDVLPNGVVLWVGVVVAFVSVVSGYVSQWRTARMQQTFAALQTLRTDREYLVHAYCVRRMVGEFGTPLDSALIKQFHAQVGPSTLEHPSFQDASRFLLNQFEFIAAATRRGLLDDLLLKQMQRGLIVGMVTTYQPIIREARSAVPSRLENLVWLYNQFEPDAPLGLGPEPKGDFWKGLGKLMGTVPANR